MRHYILYVLVLISLSAHAQQWYQRTITPVRDINAVHIQNPQDIFIAGGHLFNDSIQSLYRTDGFYWFNTLDLPITRAMLLDMTFTDSLHGYACGYNGNVIKSTDAGQTWNLIPTPITGINYRKMAFVNQLKGFAVGSNHNDSLQTIITTTNSGATWATVINQAGPGLNAITFINSDTGFAVGDAGAILETVNGGATWTSVTAPIVSNFTGIKFTTSTAGYIVGGDDTTRVILNTTDGGATWSVLKNERGSLLTAIDFSPSKGYIVGYNSSLLTSTDGGQTWTYDTVAILGNRTLTSVRFYNDSFGVIGAKGGYLFSYTHSALATTYTIGSTVIDSITVSLTMNVNTHGNPGQYFFAITTDSTWSSLLYSDYVPINANSPETHTQTIVGLAPNTRYYYFAACATLGGMATGDTFQFYTGTPSSFFLTQPATNTTATSTTLNGLVNKSPASVTLDFEFGLTPALGSSVAASPGSVSDTLSHSITANLSGLTAGNIYYYRLRGHTAGGYEYGDLMALFTGSVYNLLTTDSVSYVTDSTASLNASLDGFLRPATLEFQVGTTPYFDTMFATGSAGMISDTFYHHISTSIGHPYIQPNTLYFYRVVAQTDVGTFYGNVRTFYTGSNSAGLFNTVSATGVTGTTATMNGIISHFPTPITLSFDYGPTLAFGNSIAATPSSVSDTGTHQISASLSGLTPNAVYYYRLKGDYAGGTSYGSTKYFFTGGSEIPNWDFQQWYNDTVVLPYYWRTLSDNFAQVPGHSGNYAIQINSPNILMLGALGDGNGSNSGPQFYGGAAMNARPDSIIAFVKYNFQPGDTGGMMAFAYSGGNYIARGLWPIAGTTGGSWQRVAYAVPYMIPGIIPDSIIVGFTSVDLMASGPQSTNASDFIAIDDVSFSSPLPVPLPNADFEQWFTYGYERLVTWSDRLSYVGFDYTTLVNSKAISKAYYNAPNDFAADVSNIVVAGRLAPGSLSTQQTIFGDNHPNFPVFINHQTLNGYYKFYPVNNDTMVANISMYQNGQQIGGGQFIATDTVDNFTQFNVYISYYYPTAVADSASISITPCSGSPKGLSHAVIDKLSFDSYTVDVPDAVHKVGEKIWAYPNPAATRLNIEMSEPSPDAVITISDIDGRVAKQMESNGTDSKYQINITDLSPGLYLLNVRQGGINEVKKIVIDR